MQRCSAWKRLTRICVAVSACERGRSHIPWYQDYVATLKEAEAIFRKAERFGARAESLLTG